MIEKTRTDSLKDRGHFKEKLHSPFGLAFWATTLSVLVCSTESSWTSSAFLSFLEHFRLLREPPIALRMLSIHLNISISLSAANVYWNCVESGERAKLFLREDKREDKAGTSRLEKLLIRLLECSCRGRRVNKKKVTFRVIRRIDFLQQTTGNRLFRTHTRYYDL